MRVVDSFASRNAVNIVRQLTPGNIAWRSATRLLRQYCILSFDWLSLTIQIQIGLAIYSCFLAMTAPFRIAPRSAKRPSLHLTYERQRMRSGFTARLRCVGHAYSDLRFGMFQSLI